MVRHQLAAEPHDDAAPDPDTEPAPDLLLSPLPEVLDRLDAVPDGLSEAESARRLARTGANELTAVRGASFVSDLVRQLVHPLALLLWMAAGLALATQGAALGIAILTVIALNAAFALIQERHAEHAVAALADYLPPHAVVVREGRARVRRGADHRPGGSGPRGGG
jgi:magnesium-transporting ATPase (P-type)